MPNSPLEVKWLEEGARLRAEALKGEEQDKRWKDWSRLVGRKNANLAELKTIPGVKTPKGFAITYATFLEGLTGNHKESERVGRLLRELETDPKQSVEEYSRDIRDTVLLHGTFPNDTESDILNAYDRLTQRVGKPDVAVRSSSVGGGTEDSATNAGAGIFESYLNVQKGDLIEKIRACYASLYAPRALRAALHRKDPSALLVERFMSVGVQEMIRSDQGSAGTVFGLEPNSGNRNYLHIQSVFGLGHGLVSGQITPDSWLVYKGSSEPHIVRQDIREKERMFVYDPTGGIKEKRLPRHQRRLPSLDEEQVLEIARQAMRVQEHFGWVPDIEWALNGEIYLVQSRPETVHSTKDPDKVVLVTVPKNAGVVLAKGARIGYNARSGTIKHIYNASELEELAEGDIPVLETLEADFFHHLQDRAWITGRSADTAHVAINLRELGSFGAVVENPYDIPEGTRITVDTTTGEGIVYKGEVAIDTQVLHRGDIPKTRTGVMMNFADPLSALDLSKVGDGVGVVRVEQTLVGTIGLHGLALLNPKKVSNRTHRRQVEQRIEEFGGDAHEAYIKPYAQNLATIASAFAPDRRVIVRMPDLNPLEYAQHLIGGADFEDLNVSNPLLAEMRGARRFVSDFYQPVFEMECEAYRRVVEDMGLSNLELMVPYVRGLDEGEGVLERARRYGVPQDVPIHAMYELPVNVDLAEEFAEMFDGLSIGSNDLTQLTFGLDRLSARDPVYNAGHPVMIKKYLRAIDTAHAAGKYAGFCGAAVTDIPHVVRAVVEAGVDTISVSPDVIIPTIQLVDEIERHVYAG